MEEKRTGATARDRIVKAVQQAALVGVNPASRPRPLYHFTSAKGLLGILQKNVVWASLAMSMNDKSEFRYGLSRAEDFLKRRAASDDLQGRFAKRVAYYRQSPPPKMQITFRPFVASFCRREDQAMHWLHYGNRGTGFAVGLDPDGFPIGTKPCELVEVVYDPAAQDNLIEKLLQAALDSVAPPSPPERTEALAIEEVDFAAFIAANFLQLVAARMKAPAFESEDEWRLLTFDADHEKLADRPDEFPTCFRDSPDGRIVPYKEFEFDPGALREVVLGYSAPMDDDDPALEALKVSKKLSFAIRRSSVPVRP